MVWASNFSSEEISLPTKSAPSRARVPVVDGLTRRTGQYPSPPPVQTYRQDRPHAPPNTANQGFSWRSREQPPLYCNQLYEPDDLDLALAEIDTVYDRDRAVLSTLGSRSHGHSEGAEWRGEVSELNEPGSSHSGGSLGIKRGLRVVLSDDESDDAVNNVQPRKQHRRIGEAELADELADSARRPSDMSSGHSSRHSLDTSSAHSSRRSTPSVCHSQSNPPSENEEGADASVAQGTKPVKLHNLNKKSTNISDYDKPVGTLFTFANNYFLVLATTRGIWSDDLKYISMGKEAWLVARKRYSSDIGYDYDILAMMRRRISTTTSEIKTAISPLVDSHYHFTSSEDPRVHVRNKAIAERLVLKFGMCYSNILSAKTLAEREGLYEHPIMQQALHAAWFSNNSDVGAKSAVKKLFKPMPIPAMALLWTAIQCRIDEWRTGDGKRKDIQFSRAAYQNVLHAHINNMEKFDCVARDAKSDIFDEIRKEHLRIARDHANVEDSEDEDEEAPGANEPLPDDAFIGAINRRRSQSVASSEAGGNEGGEDE